MAQYKTLIEIVEEIEDNRQAKGKRHPLSAIIALAVAAMICGYRSYSAIAEWGRNYGPELVLALGFTRKKPPCAATFYNVLSNLDKEKLEAKLTTWAEGVIGEIPLEEGEIEALATDGKTLRGSKKQGAQSTHLLSIFSHRLEITLAQIAVDNKTNEIPILPNLLKSIILEGRVLTMDALNTQRKTAQTVVEQGGDYVMIVKDNQPKLLEQIESVFEIVDTDNSNNNSSASQQINGKTVVNNVAQQINFGHGRSELRRLTANSIVDKKIDWPEAMQVFKIERATIINSTGEISEEIVYGITSLSPQRACAQLLLNLVRGHWLIENKSHYIRDVTFDEDRSQVRKGSIPQVMAALRNTAISLIRLAWGFKIASACRFFAANPWSALALLGIFRTFK
jgi:predicted transposase YbfD/YdcC